MLRADRICSLATAYPIENEYYASSIRNEANTHRQSMNCDFENLRRARQSRHRRPRIAMQTSRWHLSSPPIALLNTNKSQLIGLLAGPYWTPEVEKSNQNNPTNAISGAPKASFFEHQKLTFSIPGLELKRG